jgi:hypothetical protein
VLGQPCRLKKWERLRIDPRLRRDCGGKSESGIGGMPYFWMKDIIMKR